MSMSVEEARFWIEAAGGIYETPPATPGAARVAEAFGGKIDPDEGNWRRLTGDSRRDLQPLTQDRSIDIAHWLWEQNPMANSIIEFMVSYLLAEGVKLTVEDEQGQKALDRFWFDPINDMDLKLPKKARELALFGEQLYPVFVNEIDGMVRLGYIDPKLIAHVVKDPDNSEQPIGVVLKRNTKGKQLKFRVVVNGPESVFSATTQELRKRSFTDGDAFYFRVNDLSAGSRGRSDLLHLADWLDGYDQFLFGELDRYKLLRALVWDITLKNASDVKVAEFLRNFTLPGSGGVYAHNDSVTLEPKTPELAAQDTSGGARLIRNHILGGARKPEHWFGGAADVNRATAAEMGGPTFKDLAMRQRILKHMLESIARYVLYQRAKIDGVHEAIDWSRPEWKPVAVMPELVAEDLDKSAGALQKVVTASASAIADNLLTRKTALLLIGAVAGRLGVDIDAEAELAAAEEEAAKRREADGFTEPKVPDPGQDAAAG